MLEKLKSKKNHIVIILPFTVYLLHSLLFGEWIIDDAGISFAYARNLGQGYGLVSQPGFEPVEGFSNPTWVFILVPFFLLKLFHPVIVPKLVSAILVFFSFVLLHKTIRLISTHYLWITFLSLMLLSINTSFVVWSCSGLENPLYVFLTILLLFQMTKFSLNQDFKTIVKVAIVTVLLALTRPDGILYLMVPVLFLLVNYLLWKENFKISAFNFILYFSVFTLLFGSFIIFRLFYFGEFFPNTYYVKGGSSFNDLMNLILLTPEMYEKIYELFSIAASIWGVYFLGGLIILTGYLIYSVNFTKQYFVVLLIMVVSGLIYIFLPTDWMGEYRFATTFFPFFYLYLFLLSEKVFQKLIRHNSNKLLLPVILIIIFIGPSIIDFAKRTNQFRYNPTVPFEKVKKVSDTVEKYAKILNIQNGSLLTPDVGAQLYYSKLRIYDQVGLIDRVVAKTFLKKQKDFYNYVFDIIKPSFIYTHAAWAYKAKFDSDVRFRRDYIPIYEYWDTSLASRRNFYSGYYLRKDLLKENNLASFQKIVQSAKLKHH